MEINSCLTSKVYLIVLILSILKGVIVYSVGRSHGSDFEFFFPTIKEWIVILLLITGLYIVGSMVLVVSVGDKVEKILDQEF